MYIQGHTGTVLLPAHCHNTDVYNYTHTHIAKIVARTANGNSNGFEVKVGMHQGSALSFI